MTKSSTTTSSTPVLVRLMLPDDANPGGTVHGGTILQLMEQAGSIAATRHVARNKDNIQSNDTNNKTISKLASVLVRLENMRFWQPLHVGQLASVTADLQFTSPHSMLFRVVVSAEDVSNGQMTRQVTNTGDFWFVTVQSVGDDPATVVHVPSMVVPEEGSNDYQSYQAGLRSYQARKALEKAAMLMDNTQESNSPCLETNDCVCTSCRSTYTPPAHGRAPSDSLQAIHRVVLPADVWSCGEARIAGAGLVLKEMDNCAGASAVRHARTNVVTIAIPQLELMSFVKLGTIVNVRSRVVYCSRKSMEVQVTATVTSMDSMHREHEEEVARGIFTFVSLNEDLQPIIVPALRLETTEDFASYYEGLQRYEASKQSRIAAK